MLAERGGASRAGECGAEKLGEGLADVAVSVQSRARVRRGERCARCVGERHSHGARRRVRARRAHARVAGRDRLLRTGRRRVERRARARARFRGEERGVAHRRGRRIGRWRGRRARARRR